MICPKCDGTGKTEIGVGAFTIHGADCDQCNGKGVIEPMTNEEHLKSCDTEQLAEALLNIMANNEFTLYLLHTEKKSVQDIKGAIGEWLKQPHQ